MRNRYIQALYFSAGFGDFIGYCDGRGGRLVAWAEGFVGWVGYSSKLCMKRSHQKTHITKGLYSI